MKPLSKEERGGFLLLLAVVIALVGYGLWVRGCDTVNLRSREVQEVQNVPSDSVDDKGGAYSFSHSDEAESGNHKPQKQKENKRSVKRNKRKRSLKEGGRNAIEECERDPLSEEIGQN